MASASFDEAFRRLLAHEGGYVHHPSDPGGPTNFGITLADYRRYMKADATAADVRAMAVAQAKAIYRAKYWNALACDRLPAGLDYAVFDYGVHSGVARASRVLRHLAGMPAGASIDTATLAAVGARDAKALIVALCDERLAFLKRLKTWPTFGRGWARRMAEVRAGALAMADGTHAPAKPSAQAGGKGITKVSTKARKGAAGAVVAGGAVAAERAAASGLSPAIVFAIALVAAALAFAVWRVWRWRQEREQLRVAPSVSVIAKEPQS